MASEPVGDGELDVTVDRCRARVGVKWHRYGGDVIPAFVADMDFDPPAPVLQAVAGHADRGDLGYGPFADVLAPAWADWQERRHGWRPDVDRVRAFTSVLHALEVVLWHMTAPGDGVVVFPPVYYPFLDAIADSGRRRVDVPLDPDGWRIDPDRLEAAIDPGTKLILFCHPHNPTGRVFDAEEISAVARVAERHDLLVVSDEVWGDLTYPSARSDTASPFRPLAECDERFAGRLVTLSSASKAFNLAGLRTAVAHVDHEPLVELFASMPSHIHGSPSTIGITATLAAWAECDDWLGRLRTTLAARRAQLGSELAERLPEVGFAPPEATYLAWLDFRNTPIGAEPSRAVLKEGGVALSAGPQFGPGGDGFARLNFATSPTVLSDMVGRIANVIAAATSPSPASAASTPTTRQEHHV